MQARISGWAVLFWCAVCASRLVLATEPATAPPSTQPALSDRQASILLQLADAEANIKVINQALVRTGYKVGLAYERIENSQKANELMDRKGGGPVRWDEFYGRTARDFYAPQNAGALHAQTIGASVDLQVATGYRPLQRPPQFEYIYHANDGQIAKAREQIATLLENQAALLARRNKHEADQSALWAELAWEQVRDREIAFRPGYRFALKGDAARVALLRGPVQFLRMANQALVDGLESIESDQAETFDDLRSRTKAAYATLQETMSTALLTPNISEADSKQAGELKAVCKQIAEECVVIDDNYRKAADSDRANEDASKLEYRGQLQTSLARLAGLIGGLDEQVSNVAAGWGLKPDLTSQLPQVVFSPLNSRTASPPISAGASQKSDSDGAFEKLTAELSRLDKWTTVSGNWKITSDNRIRGEGDSELRFNDAIPRPCSIEFQMQVVVGMRPRIHFDGPGIYIANEGYQRTLMAYGKKQQISGEPSHYASAEPVRVHITFSGDRFTARINDHVIGGQCGGGASILLRLSAGDSWSKGTCEFWGFTVSPAAQSESPGTTQDEGNQKQATEPAAEDQGSSTIARAPPSSGKTREHRFDVTNRTNAPEAETVIDAAAVEYPQDLSASAKFTLVKVHDASEFQRNGNATQGAIRGSYAQRAAAGNSGGAPILCRIYEKWPPGDYLIVYRVQALSPVSGKKVCFLDVCTDGRTIARHYPTAAEFGPGNWSCMPVHVKLTEPTELEYRLWTYNDAAIALDRVYIYQVH